jgi:signal transduction histidine kinase
MRYCDWHFRLYQESLTNVAQTKTLGLLGMKERVLMMKGNLDINSEPGKGTTVTVTVPLHKEKMQDEIPH